MEDRLDLLARGRGRELVDEFVGAPQEDTVLRRFLVNVAPNAVELRGVDRFDNVFKVVLHEWQSHITNFGLWYELLLGGKREFKLCVVRIAKVEVRSIRIHVSAQVRALNDTNIEKRLSVVTFEARREVGEVFSELVAEDGTLIGRI